MSFEHLAPGDGGCKAVFEAELGLQEFMHAANDIRNDGLRGVEDTTLNFELLVVGGEEVLVEMDDGVFAARAFAEVSQDRRQVSLIPPEKFHHILDAKDIE